ncbi:phosphonate metabolism protein/1,5-bisphosphokinase (PRPP-forming) PhnN [Roseobacter litoralis]|uniref:Multifunctional fusion protein n=1 Tax=Roseobacter litoralis (strain ATCC 49566 / DSM 6996 / JCM 21268 / NBRC 15278 / OCh 149) TaxID=391595 RepID=F7ZJV1_ROSLO|nr:phosphonate metabolism protein/1,5-bisphosphokinase (PRPP-forming) PhnN [Roseobacter litoralis]AEI95126.1 putative thymidine phosphorylase [Roseobacter litoralis Och 149]
MPGTLFLIVGPSGVGKDTLLEGARDRLANSQWFSFPQRVVTRAADAGGEDYIPITPSEFKQQLAAGAFWHHWHAHGLSYGIPMQVARDLENGVNVVLNASRNEIGAFRDKVAHVVTIGISAPPGIVEQRLYERGRESEEEVKRRLARLVEQAPLTGCALEIVNDGTIEEGIAGLVDLIAGACDLRAEIARFPVTIGSKQVCLIHKGNQIASRVLAGSSRVTLSLRGKSVSAELGETWSDEIVSQDLCALSEGAMAALDAVEGDVVSIERSPTPKSRSILQKKVRGGELSHAEMEAFIHDLVNGRFSTSEIAGFLVAASNNLTMDEVISLTQVRAAFAHRHDWGKTIVVDKHSMGGVPGNRITPIIIPILAAFGLTVPKTSSRAITSAAGTADMMEVLSRVDLSPDEMKSVVEQTNGCIAWNGNLTHSPVDDVMNAINRPLGLQSTLLDVSSIMSKKLAAGSTHVLIDMPVGPKAKTRTQGEAGALKDLFESVGQGIGLNTKVQISDGTKPIGRGVGPVLEALDVLSVLRGEAGAPTDLLDKSIGYAATILEWSGAVSQGQGAQVARDLVSSGKAVEKLFEIRNAQGRQHDPLQPGQFTEDICADSSGRLEAIDIQAISEIARLSGAPKDKAAGVVLSVQVGDEIMEKQPLLRVHSSSLRGIEEAVCAAQAQSAFKIL